MDWTIRPLHTTNFLGKNIQVQRPYQSQQTASGFSQANASTQNSSAYTGNDPAIKIHFNTENMVANQLPSSNTVASNNFQSPLLKLSVPVTGFGTTQHFVDPHPGSHMQLSSMTVQVTPGTAKNAWPNSHAHIFSTAAPDHSTANPVQGPLNPYIASDMYNSYPQKKSSIQASVWGSNINNSSSKRLPMIMAKYQPVNPQTNTTVPLKTLNHFVNSQPNSSCVAFPSGQNIQNQIHDISSGSTTTTPSQQYVSNCVYTPHPIPNHYAGQVIPQTTNTNFPPPPYPVPPIQVNHEQFVLPQPVPNMSNENSQNPQNHVLEQSSALYSIQSGPTLESVPISKETNEVGSTANSVHGHRAENKTDELKKLAVEDLKSLSSSLQIAGAVPSDKMSEPQTTRTMVEDNIAKSLMKSKPITRESLELDMQKICEIKKKFLALKEAFDLKRKLFIITQNSNCSDPSVQNPNLSFPSRNTSQNQPGLLSQDTHSKTSLSSCNTNQKQPLLLPQAINETAHLPTEATPKPTSWLPHENTQNQTPLHFSSDSSQMQDGSSLPLRTAGHLFPILQELLKGTIDEEMLLNLHAASAERNQRKPLLVHEKCSSGSVLDSSGGKLETSVNGMERTSRLSPKTFQTVSAQEPLTCAKVSPEQTSASGKEQLMNMTPVSERDLLNHFVLNKDKVGTTVTKIQPNLHNAVSIQNPTVSSEYSQLREKIVKEISACSEFKQQTPEKSFTTYNNRSGISSSETLAVVPETELFQRSSITGNSCIVERTCSLEELETSLALWRKSPAASLNDQLAESTKSTMNSSSLGGAEDKKMEHTITDFPNPLTHNEKSSIVFGKNEPTLPSVTSTLGQKLDAVSSSLLKSSEPQVAIVPPLILSKEGMQNEVQAKNLSSMLEAICPDVAEDNIHSLHDFVFSLSDTDKPRERTICSPSDTCVTVKRVDSDMYQKTTISTEETGIQKAETGTHGSCDLNQRMTDLLEWKKNIPHLSFRDSFPPGINNDTPSPVSPKDAPKTNPNVVELGDTMLNDNILQISSVCTLVQGDVFYNSQIANIFNSSPLTFKAESNTSSEDHRPDSYNKEQQLGLQKRDSERNGSTPVGDALSPSLGSLSKAIAEKLLSLPGLKMPLGGKVSDEINVKDPTEEKITYVTKDSPNSGTESEQNKSCDDVHNTDLASGNQEVPGNKCLFSYVDEDSTLSIQEHVASDENRAHSVNDTDITLTSPDDQLTELLKEFPYGIDGSKTLKKTENEDSATKLTDIKYGQEAQTCGQNFEANRALDQIVITVLNTQQMKELFPEYSGSSNKLEKDQLLKSSEDTETIQKPANHSYCCLRGWLGSKYVVDPCACTLAKEAALKQQLNACLPSKIIIKGSPETNENSSTDCRLNDQQQTVIPISNNILPSEDESNKILNKTIAHGENDLQEKQHKLLKEDKELTPLPFLEAFEYFKYKNKENRTEEFQGKVQTDEMCKQKCTALVSKGPELSYSRKEDSKEVSIRPLCKRESTDKERPLKEMVVAKSKSDSLRHGSIETKQSKNNEGYKIKQDSSETHIIKGPTYTLNKGLKRQTATEREHKTLRRPCNAVTNSSNFSGVDLAYKMCNNAHHSQEYLSRQKCEIEKASENHQAVRTEHNESGSSEPVQHNIGSFARTNLDKFAYPEERGNAWKYRRSLSDKNKTSKVQTLRGQFLKMYKMHSSTKETVWSTHKRDKYFEKTLSDKKYFNRKGNILTLQREQKKNYLNKVAFKQTEQSICLTNLEQSPSKSVWHVKRSSTSESPKDQKNGIPSTQQPEVVKPMLEFKMCPEPVFRNLVSEEVSDTKKLPEKETTAVAAVKSKREDWLKFTPLKRRKIDDKETPVDDRIPIDTALQLLEKNEVLPVPAKDSSSTFQTYRKMHLEKTSRSLDSTLVN